MLGIAMGLGNAQTEYGTVQLPLALADVGAKVLGVLNQNPTSKSILGYSEGPAVDSLGNLFFTEFDPAVNLKSTIWKVPPTGTATVFYTSTEGSNGLEFDPQGRLVAAQDGAIRRFNADGSRTALAISGNGVDLKRTNDLSIANSGAMYFTNHATGNNVFYLGTDGKVKTFTGFDVPNGVEWIEERKTVFVTFAITNGKVMKYIAKDDGTLIGGIEFASVPEPDGLTADEQGNLYVASYHDGAIMVFDSTGKSLGKIVVKSANTSDLNQSGNTSNCVFGGPGLKTLYITGDGGAYKVELKVPGRKRPTPLSLRSKTGFFRYPSLLLAASGASVNLIGRSQTAGILPEYYIAKGEQAYSLRRPGRLSRQK
jgi:sugar lactone lactonase YvrE